MNVPRRYARNIEALSEQECETLARARVTVLGCGGLGGLVIEALARIGVGSLRVVDGDVFEESNLNRQVLCTEENLNKLKAVAAVERVCAINRDVSAVAVAEMLTEHNALQLIEGADCVVDCLDNLEARFWAAHACQEANIPLVYGAIAGWFGQVCTVFPGDHSFATVYGTTEGESAHKALGNLPFTAYTTAAIQASECVKVLLDRPGQLRNRLLMIDLLDGSFDEIELR